MELVEHGPQDADGPCSVSCRQGGLDLMRMLREKYPSLLEGISHEEVFAPQVDAQALQELQAWKSMAPTPGGRTFRIGTEDYVGSCGDTSAAQAAYNASLAAGFSSYATDSSGAQQGACYWLF